MSEDELWNRLRAAGSRPYGRAHIAELEEILRQVDAQGSPRLKYTTRLMIANAYRHGGEPAKAFVPFSWCLAAHDAGESEPDLNFRLFWQFKGTVNAMAGFPEIPLAQTYAVLDDMERRYRLGGHTMNPVHQHRELIARHIGDKAVAREQYRLWTAAPRGEMSDCEGCEPNSKVAHLTWLGEFEDAVRIGDSVLGGQFDCVEQPQSILTAMLVPYVRTGRLAEAARAHRQAYRAVQSTPSELQTVGVHLSFCALTGNHARGLQLLERHLGWLDSAPTPLGEMSFSASAANVLSLVEADGHGNAPIGDVTVRELRARLSERATAIAARFDARNGTSRQGDWVRDRLAQVPVVDFLPLSGPVREPASAVPVAASFPDSPAELASLAERQHLLDDKAATAAAWARFDELLPSPDGALLARRLVGAGNLVVNQVRDVAVTHWSRAAEVYRGLGDEVAHEAVRSRLGLLKSFGGEGTDEITASVERLAKLGDAEQYGWGLLRLAQAALVSGESERAMALLDDARKPIEEAGIALQAAQLLQQTAEFSATMSEALTAEPLGLLDDAASRYLAAGAPIRAAGARLSAARLKAIFGDLEEAAALFTGVVTDFAAYGNALGAARAKVELASACLHLERFEEVADRLEEAIPVLRDAEEDFSQAQFMLARTYRALRQPDQALELLAEVSEFCISEGNQAGAGQMHELSGEILDDLDRDAQAAASFARAAELFHEADFAVDELRTRRRATLSWHWARDHDRALAALSATDAHAATLSTEDPQTRWEHSMLNYDAARILVNLERPAEALPRVIHATEGFRAVDSLSEAAAAGALHGRILRDLDRPAEAHAVLTQALATLPADATNQRAHLESLLADLTP
ncbi:tol-pal system YbgF family protein [Amycolatopsis sp. cg5]|uniref:tol-pal system YbgF family protein n=1 Tax=Amycolatopsis sp. cg5 TaxID=3238802 RepID=UPI003524A3CD